MKKIGRQKWRRYQNAHCVWFCLCFVFIVQQKVFTFSMSFTRGVRDVVSTKSLVQTITFRQPTFHKKRVRVGHLSNDGKRLFRRLHFFWGKMFHRQFFYLFCSVILITPVWKVYYISNKIFFKSSWKRLGHLLKAHMFFPNNRCSQGINLQGQSPCLLSTCRRHA